ncbi:hypothetical protein D3C73_1417010 [compost metagenome]
MADGSDNLIVALRIKPDNLRSGMYKQCFKRLIGLLWHSRRGCQHIIGVLEQQRRSSLHAGTLRSCHGMSTDKMHPGKVQRQRTGGNRRLGAAHIRDNTARLQGKLAKALQIILQHAYRHA